MEADAEDGSDTLVMGLEYLANLFERDLIRTFSTGDPETNAWFRKRTREMASAFRQLKKLTIKPRANYYDRLTSALASALENTAQGNWDQLERAEYLARRAWLFRFRSTIPAIGGIPAVFLFVILAEQGALPVEISATVRDSLLIAAIGGGALSVKDALSTESKKN